MILRTETTETEIEIGDTTMVPDETITLTSDKQNSIIPLNSQSSSNSIGLIMALLIGGRNCNNYYNYNFCYII